MASCIGIGSSKPKPIISQEKFSSSPSAMSGMFNKSGFISVPIPVAGIVKGSLDSMGFSVPSPMEYVVSLRMSINPLSSGIVCGKSGCLAVAGAALADVDFDFFGSLSLTCAST